MNRSIPTLASSLFSLGKLGFLGKMPPVSLHSSVNSSVSRHLVRFPPPSGSWRPDRDNGFRPTSHRLLAMKKKTIDTNRYRLFRKGAYGTYYIKDTVTHRQTSLKTTDRPRPPASGRPKTRQQTVLTFHFGSVLLTSVQQTRTRQHGRALLSSQRMPQPILRDPPLACEGVSWDQAYGRRVFTEICNTQNMID
jgi:hypothetical protein